MTRLPTTEQAPAAVMVAVLLALAVVVHLGILYQDNANQKRWTLEVG